MADPQVNFFKSTLVGTYSNTDTSFTIATGDGALLPDPSTDGEYNLTIFEGLQVTNSTSFEIVRVTARSGDVLTVTRGQESTTPLTIGSATHSILMSATKKTFDDINTAIANVDLTSLTSVEELSFDTTGNEILRFPLGTTAQRPNSPQTGYVRYNTDTSSIEFYNGTNWLRLQAVEFNSLALGVASATVSGNDATAISNVIANAERLTFNSSGDESFSLPAGTEAQRPTASAGYMRYNTDENVIEAYIDGEWVQMGSSVYLPVEPFFGGRGVFGAGANPSLVNTMDYITIDTEGNAVDFGDLSQSKQLCGSCSGEGRGLFAGGETPTQLNVIDYITIATTGNATDFGDLTRSNPAIGAVSDGYRGVFAGGERNQTNIMDYVTIATTGNASDFGDLPNARQNLGGASSSTRGLFAGGYTTTYLNEIVYITIQTTGNTTDFGDLTVARYNTYGCSDGSRALFGGGVGASGRLNTIDYVTIDTTGNATDFGDLTVSRDGASCSNGGRGVFGGGYDGANRSNVIDYVTIQTTGNATDFGDLTIGRSGTASCSGD